MKKFLLIIWLISFFAPCFSQDAWKDILRKKRGTVVINYYDSENYIIKKNGKFEGIEYDLILELFKFIEQKYQVKINIKFERANSFGELFQDVRFGKMGNFGACSFSMTDERKAQVNFTPRYLPDIEVMISSKDLPVVEDSASFIKNFQGVTAYAVKNTTFEQDILQIKQLIPNLKIVYLKTGVEVLAKVANEKRAIGYAELPNYITSFKNSYSVKRQTLFRVDREGHGLIYPKKNDWNEPIEAFFKEPSFHVIMNRILRKRLGNDIKDLILEMEDRTVKREINLLNKELELQGDELAERELQFQRERLIRNLFIGAIILFALIVFLLFYLNKVKNKANQNLSRQKEEISKQKQLIEETNKNMLDSINYAKLIQDSILPSQQQFDEILPNSFVFYRPKDIVSGDFYFIGKPFNSGGQDISVFAVGDCTGHGVPGALLSIIGKTFLQLGLTDHKVDSCAKALDYLNEGVSEILRSKFSTIRDGMDIAMCAINYDTLQLEFSGGNNPAYILRGEQIVILKPNKQGIGDVDREDRLLPYDNKEFQLQKGDSVYLFSDGFSDQFGGPRGKKYRTSQLRKLLVEIDHLPMQERLKAIETSFLNWKGDLEQVDDVCLLGVQF